jgi:hypothetical protein
MLSESSCFGYSSDDPFPGGSLLVWTEDVEWSILIPNPLMKTYSLPPNSETGRSAGMEDLSWSAGNLAETGETRGKSSLLKLGCQRVWANCKENQGRERISRHNQSPARCNTGKSAPVPGLSRIIRAAPAG